MKRSPHGSPRMCCGRCHRGLERAHPKALELEPAAQPLWVMIAAFEAALRGVLTGRVPDQFRFNDTSAAQLLEETSIICVLFASAHRHLGLRDGLFDRLATPALTLGHFCPDEPSSEMPLALASPPPRRCMIATCAAILDADCGATGLCQSELVVDIWARIVVSIALQHFIQDRLVCSSMLKRKMEAARHRNEQIDRMSYLRDASNTYKYIFRGAA